MKQNDFYELDGCTDFIPVKLIEEHKHMTNTLEVELTETGYRTVVPKVNEPQKPVVPKFVAEWIEANEKKEFYARLDNLIFDSYVHQLGTDMTSFIYGRTEKIKELIFAYEFGYEVEQEKLYTVEIPDPNSSWKYTFLTKKDYRGVIIHKTDNDCWKKDKI